MKHNHKTLNKIHMLANIKLRNPTNNPTTNQTNNPTKQTIQPTQQPNNPSNSQRCKEVKASQTLLFLRQIAQTNASPSKSFHTPDT